MAKHTISIPELILRFQSLKSNRAVWESHWQELAKYCLPSKATVTTTRTPGTKYDTDVYDSTAIQAVQIMAAGLHSYLTNPSSRWFALRLQNRELMDDYEIKDWLKDSEGRIFDTLNSSNFNQQIHETYIDLGTFNTAILYEEEDPEDIIRFYTRPVAEIFIVENERGRVDTIFRHFTFTARQAYQKWGENSGKKVLDLMEAKKYEERVSFLHIVLPRSERNVGKKDASNKPVASLYVEISAKKKLSEGGYEEFPFFATRFTKVSGEVYGRGPSMTSLADIKTLNQMSKTLLKAGHKAVDPPLQGPSDGYILPIKTSPGALNFRNSTNAEDKFESLYSLNMHNIPMGLELENQRRNSIKSAFFVDLFLLLTQEPKMTATEVLERVNEKMLILGPTLGRLMSELLDPIVTRTFNILSRNGMLAPVPPGLEGQNYKVEYISPLAKAQKASETQSIRYLFGAVREMMDMAPDVVDNFNFDKASKEIANIQNNSELIRSDDEIKAIREQRAQAQQVQQALEQAGQGAEVLEKVMGAEKATKGGE